MAGILPRSAFLRTVGSVVHSPLRAGVIAPCEHAAARPLETVPPQPQGASDLTAPSGHPGHPPSTNPTQRLQSGLVSTQLPSCSAAVSQQPIITAQNKQRSELAFTKPNHHLPGRQCTAPAGKRFVAAGALHHPGASQDPSSAKTRHQPTGPPTNDSPLLQSVGR